MGGGKGTPEYWVAVVRPGRILSEIDGGEEKVAREAFRLVHGRPEILRWLLWRGPCEVEELEQSFASWSCGTESVATPASGSDDGAATDFLFAVTENEGGAFVGTTSTS